MKRSSADVAKSHARIVEEAARLFRERGADGVSIPDVMAAAGMTHGGFYGHFASKDALLAEAIQFAFNQVLAGLDAPSETALQPMAFVDRYLTTAHAANRGAGCPIASLACDSVRGEAIVRDSMAAGVDRAITALTEAIADQAANPRQEALRALSGMVGSLILARSLSDQDRQREVLEAMRTSETIRALLNEPD
jgi:TetR/AcrR family transcriptional repressor of nem operon